jgi:hypothetical protein
VQVCITLDLEELAADAVHAAVAVEPRGADLEHHRRNHRLHRHGTTTFHQIQILEQSPFSPSTTTMLLLLLLLQSTNTEPRTGQNNMKEERAAQHPRRSLNFSCIWYSTVQYSTGTSNSSWRNQKNSRGENMWRLGANFV